MESGNDHLRDLPTESLARLEEAAQRFEGVWQRGERPRIEDYLPAEDGERFASLVELILVDVEYRLKVGEAPRVEEYVKRYPEVAGSSGAILVLISHEYHLRKDDDASVSVEEYLDRFPQYRNELAERFASTDVTSDNASGSDDSDKPAPAASPDSRGNARPETPTSTSISLLDEVRNRAPEAWRRFVHLYTPLAYHWCRQSGLPPEDAADVLQEVFRAVAGGVKTFHHDRPGAFRAWLWTIARNKIRDHFRRKKKQPDAMGGSDAFASFQQLPDILAEDSADFELVGEREILVRQAIEMIRNEFEERTWQAFWRAVVDNHAPSDIAADLGMTTNAVYKAKSRVLGRLRDEMNELID